MPPLALQRNETEKPNMAIASSPLRILMNEQGIIPARHPGPLGDYVSTMSVALQNGNQLLWVSGLGPWIDDGRTPITGTVCDHESGQQAARQVALCMLWVLDEAVGLERVRRLIWTDGMVNTTLLADLPKVIDGFSGVMKTLW